MKTIAQQIKWDFKTNGDLDILDKNGKLIYFENSDGYWAKCEYNSNSKPIYYENSTGAWEKYEYDSQGNRIYYEDSYGKIEDNRPKSCENREIVIEGIKYKLIKQ